MTTAARQEIAKRLRMARKASGLSQAQVAQRLGMSRPTVTEIEAGRRALSAEELPVLAEIYGVDVGWILGHEAVDNKAGDELMLAARELQKMSKEDLDRLLRTVTMLKETK